MSFMYRDEYQEYLEDKYRNYDSDGGMFSNHYSWENDYDFNEKEYEDYCSYKIYGCSTKNNSTS